MAKFTKIIKENTQNLLIQKFIRLFNNKIRNNKKRRFSFVLTGGESPIRLYKFLAKNKKIPWNKVDFFIGDERYVNETSKNSNINMCKKYLLNKIKISNKQIYKISTNHKKIYNSVNDYNNKIKKYFFNKKVSFDLILLGIGNDGHIASLFNNNIKKKSNKNIISVKKKDFFRISLTLKCINNSKAIFLWAPGKEKKQIVRKILLDLKYKYPASHLKKENNFLFYSN